MSAKVANIGLLSAGQRPRIPPAVVAGAANFVDRTGIADQVATWRNIDRAKRHPGGRPPVLNDRVVLVVLLLLAAENSPLLASRAEELLTKRLDAKSLKLLGIDLSREGVNWYSCFWRAWRRFHDTLDAFPAPRHRYMDEAEQKAIIEARDKDACAERAKRLAWVANTLIDGTWKMLPREVRRRWKGNIAIDATPVVAHAKPRTKRSTRTVEPDAAWYLRRGDHRDPGDESGKSVKRSLFGWETHIAIATANDACEAPGFPLLATAMAFDKPGFNVAENAMGLLLSMRDRKMPIGIATTDRAYWPGAKMDKLQLPARAMGWRNCNDYKDDQLGAVAHHEGAVLVEGAWYTEAMPKPLQQATVDYRGDKIDDDTWQARIAARAPYLVKAKGRPNSQGDQRVMCPGSGPSPTMYCPHCTPSTAARAQALPQADPSTSPSKLCRQGSVSIPAIVGAKFRQDIRYGTPEWQRHYATARNTIEGFNGFIKDGAREGLADAKRRRFRGRTAQHLLVSLLLTAANIRKIRTWEASQPSDAEPVPTIKRRAKRRTTPVLGDFLPESNAPPGLTGTEN